MPKISRELLILVVGRVLQVVISLVIIKLATKYLPPLEMGNLYLILSITGFFGLFLINPIGQYINRKTFEWYEEKNILNVFYIFNFYVLFISLLSPVVVLILRYFGIAEEINFMYLLVFIALFIYFTTWNQTIIPMINMLGNRIIFVVFTLATQLLFLLLAYIFISIFKAEGIFWFLGQITSFGVITFFALFYFIFEKQKEFNFKKAHQLVSKINFNKILKFSFPLSLSVLFFWMQTQSYSIIIEKNIGAEFLGYFGVGMSISLAISGAFETIIIQYIYPKMYKSMNNEYSFQNEINNLINIIMPIYFLLAIFVTIFAKYITTILVDSQYHSSYIFLIFGIWIAFFKMSSNMIGNIAHAKMKTGNLIIPYFFGALIAVSGVIFATTLTDYQYYIPLALILSVTVSFLMMYIMMNKLVKIKINVKNFYVVSIYSTPFLFVYFFSDYVYELLYAMGVVGAFGLYFLYIIYKITLAEKVEDV